MFHHYYYCYYYYCRYYFYFYYYYCYYYYYLCYYYYYYYYYYLKYLAVMTSQLWQVRRPGGTLIKAVKQSYNVCCLTGHVFKGVQWGNMNNMKVMPRRIGNLCRAYPNYCIGSWGGVKHSCIRINLPLPYLLTVIATLLINSVTQNK